MGRSENIPFIATSRPNGGIDRVCFLRCGPTAIAEGLPGRDVDRRVHRTRMLSSGPTETQRIADSQLEGVGPLSGVRGMLKFN